MKRTYELALVLDADLNDEEQVALVDDVKAMITGTGAEIVKEESWGKRKLAYPIDKKTDGRYVFLYVVADGVEATPPFREIEKRLNQNERVLRYLTVRTDEDLRRAIRKAKRVPPTAEVMGLVPPGTTSAAAPASTGRES